MATKAPKEPVVGTFKPKAALHAAGHSAGFDQALDNALSQLKEKWGIGKFKNVRVNYAADISVTNPGTIDTYIVNLMP
jgi:hypothetical protein